MTVSWNPTEKPLYQQKPADITKQKADKEKKIQNRNAQRAAKLGIQYLPQNRTNMKKLILFLLLAIATLQASAQCTFRNTAFKSGEFISYNLYFNWKFVWVKAGTASISTVATTYQGKSAYRTSLITRGSSKADKFFLMRDTLLCYNTQKWSLSTIEREHVRENVIQLIKCGTVIRVANVISSSVGSIATARRHGTRKLFHIAFMT